MSRRPLGPLTSSSGAQFEFRRTRAPSTIRPRFSIFGRQKVRVLAPTWSQSRNQIRADRLEVSQTCARETYSSSLTAPSSRGNVATSILQLRQFRFHLFDAANGHVLLSAEAASLKVALVITQMTFG